MKKALISLSFTVIAIIFTISYFGIYFGWLDDVILANYLQGIFLGKPISEFFTAHILLSKIYFYLYQYFKNIGWYGVFLLMYNLFAVFNIFYLISAKWDSIHRSNFVKISIICIGIYLLLIAEHIILLTYTRTSLLLIGSSLLLLDYFAITNHKSVKTYLWFTYLIFCILLGLLIRFDVAFFITFPFIFYYGRNIANIKYLTRICAVLFTTIVLFTCLLMLNFNEEISSKNKIISHILNISDGKNIRDDFFLKIASQDISYKAVLLSYLPDDKFYDSKYLDKWGPRKVLSVENFQKVYEKLGYELRKAKTGYPDEYLKSENWFLPFIYIFIFNALVLFYGFVYFNKKYLCVYQTLFLFSYYVLITLSLLVFKMEGRVAIPSSAIVLLANFTFLAENVSSISKRYSRFILVLLVLITFFKFSSLNHLSYQKKNELALKMNFSNELNQNFNNKLIFFDIWTMSLFQNKTFFIAPHNPSNQYLTHKESWSGFIDSHNLFLDSLCGNNDFVSFYKCMFEKKEQVVFVYTKEVRIGFLEQYAREVHNYELVFKEIFPNSELKKIKFTFLPYKYEFGYYTLEKFNRMP